MAVAAINAAGIESARKQLRGQLVSGQHRIHFNKESNERRRKVINLICQQGWHTLIVIHPSKNEVLARSSCLDAVIRYAIEVNAVRMVIETDDSARQADKRALFDAGRRLPFAEDFTYNHMRARNEELLWVPDAIAWCFARGGEWRKRIEPVLYRLIYLE